MFDFLYSDHERVASFLSQLDGIGALTHVEQAGSKSKTKSGEAGLDFGVIKGGGSHQRDWQREVRQAFDPLWRNSMRLVEEITAKDEPESQKPVQLGQLRILTGSLLAYDLSSLTSIMQTDAMEQFIADGIPENAGDEKRSPKAKARNKKNEAAVLRSFIKDLPLGIGFVLVTESNHFWFGVKKEFLSLNTLDIPLKFPTHVSGDWSVLGIVDAVPEDHVEGMRSVLNRKIDGLFPEMVLRMLQLNGVSTRLFGRPVTAHGLSPLVVFRTISN